MSFFEEFLNDPAKLYPFLGAAAAVSLPLLVNTCKDFYFDLKKRKTERNYIIVQLIFLLDEFASKCGEVAWDEGYDPFYPEPNEHEYEPQVEQPIFSLSAVKGEHKYLDPLILYRLQNINVEIHKAKERLREITNHPAFDYDDVHHYYAERRKLFAQIGIYAIEISDDLRKTFHIPLRDDWSPRDTIQRSLKSMWRSKANQTLKNMARKAERIMIKHNKLSKISASTTTEMESGLIATSDNFDKQ